MHKSHFTLELTLLYKLSYKQYRSKRHSIMAAVYKT